MTIKQFIPNEDDDLHCLQACVRMILTTEEGELFSLADAERMTGYRAGEQTWPYEMMLGFAGRGFRVIDIETVDQEVFSKNPEAAMVQEYGQEIWEHIQKVSDVPRAQKAAIACLEHSSIVLEKRIPRLQDIDSLLDEGWWIIVNINARRLNGRDGYNGHFALVDKRDGELVLQNPGLPPQPNQKVMRQEFLNAWQYPTEKAANLIAIKKMIPRNETISPQRV